MTTQKYPDSEVTDREIARTVPVPESGEVPYLLADPGAAAAVNEALLISGLREHELKMEAEDFNVRLRVEIEERTQAQASLREAQDRLAKQAVRLEELVVERTAELRATTHELEAFSYSIAHDMREPLRGMRGFAEILMSDHASQLDAVGKNYLGRIAKSAARMDTLIQDALAYAEVRHADAVLVRVDLDRLTRELIAIYPDWQAPNADIEVVGTIPAVMGHEVLLTKCVSNLLSNAVKFVEPGVRPRVRIWAEVGFFPIASAQSASASRAATPRSMVRVWFENNGIGIAPKDRDRIFRMFERLNSNAVYQGSGIGLTVVRRAVERMGGAVDLESLPGQGSRFWIALPEATSS